MKTRTIAAAALAVALAAAPALRVGAAEERFSYKGRLAKADDSAFDTSVPMQMSFRLYDVPAGGQALWGRDMAVRMEADGSFYVELSDEDGSAIAGTVHATLGAALASSTNFWIGLAPSGYSEIAPRQPLATAPRALSATAARDVGTAKAPSALAETLDVRSAGNVAGLAVTGSFVQGPGTTVLEVPENVERTVEAAGGIKVTHSISGIRTAGAFPSDRAPTDLFAVLLDADGLVGGWCSLVIPRGAPVRASGREESSFPVTFGSAN